MREGDTRNSPGSQQQELVQEDHKASEEQAEMSPEKIEELKLMKKFPQQNFAGGVQSHFLQKRLQQRKFFDSGDYNMAKAKGLKFQNPLAPKTAKPPLAVVVDEPSDGSTSPTGVEIPTPDTVPQRKTSLVQPAASKLSPQPIHHHCPDTSLLTTLETS